jgi:RHS repeat-associated protein
LDNLGRKDYAFEKFWTEYGEQKNEIDWEYDEAGRLIYEKFDHYNDEFDQTSDWIYDLVGNRLKQTVNGTITTYNYDINDRLLNEVTNNKTTIYGYDHTQQTSKKVTENSILISETTFGYDAQGRMSIVTITSRNRTEITKYKYGTDGIRVSAEHEVWEDGELKLKTKTEYLNDPLNITGYSQVLKQTETNFISEEETVTTYVIGHQCISQIVVKNGTEQEYYFTFDGHGSTRVLLNFAGAIAQLYAFDAYGNAIGFDPSVALTEFLYSGEQFDSKIGQQYLRARYYDPTTGRFNRLDPFFGNLNDPQSLHKYLYTHADPVNGYDYTGLSMMTSVMSACSIGMKIAAAHPLITASILGGCIGLLANGVSNYSMGHGFFENVDWAVGTGVLLGPAAVAFPFLGMGLAMWGMYASTAQMFQVFGNPNSSMGQHAASLALIGLAGLGTYSAVKNIQVNGFWYNTKIFTPNGSAQLNVGDEGPGVIRVTSTLEINAQQQPNLRNIPRVNQDINVNPTAPPQQNPVGRTIGTNANQNRAVADYVNTLQKLNATDIRVNQQQINIHGERVGINQPDLQYTLSGKRIYVEWDRVPASRAIPHGERIMANDPDGIVYLYTMD